MKDERDDIINEERADSPPNGQPVTIYDLRGIVGRCLVECIDAGYIEQKVISTSDASTDVVTVIINRDEVIKHISNTIIGELTELEMIRKLSPIFRGVKRLADDFEYLDDRGRVAQQMAGLRISTEGEPSSGTQGKEGKEK